MNVEGMCWSVMMKHFACTFFDLWSSNNCKENTFRSHSWCGSISNGGHECCDKESKHIQVALSTWKQLWKIFWHSHNGCQKSKQTTNTTDNDCCRNSSLLCLSCRILCWFCVTIGPNLTLCNECFATMKQLMCCIACALWHVCECIVSWNTSNFVHLSILTHNSFCHWVFF